MILTTKNPDGTYTVFYFGKIIGWCQKAQRGGWRALSVHGDLRHLTTLGEAREAVVMASRA